MAFVNGVLPIILPVCYFIFSTSRHWHYWYHVGEKMIMDSTRLQDFLAFAFVTYIRLSTFPLLPVLAFTHRIPIPYYLSILSIYHRLLLWKQSETSLDSSIQLPRKYIISYTHSIAISLIHHMFFLHKPRRIQDSKFCVYTYIHYITHRRDVDSLSIPLPPPFFLFPSHPFVRLLHFRVLLIIEIVMSF